MNQKILLQPAFVLHRRPYRETSLLLEIFSKDYGRWPIIAKSARRNRSPFRGILEPFQKILISWTAKGELGNLTAVEPINVASSLKSVALISGFYLNELIMRLLPRDDSIPDLFELYGDSLLQLGSEQGASLSDIQRILRIFEKRLLESIGYGLLLNCEGDSRQPINPNCRYFYDFLNGPIRADIGDNNSNNSAFSISGKNLLNFYLENLNNEECLNEVKLLMREALKLRLDNRPLQSRQLLRDLNQVMYTPDILAVNIE